LKYLRISSRLIGEIIPSSRVKNFFLGLSGIKVHSSVFIGRRTTFIDKFRPRLIEIHERVSISPGCIIVAAAVPEPSDLKNNERNVKIKKIIIESDVWLGSGVIVLPGITIGKQSIIGAGSVVTKNIPPIETWVVSPAAKIKYNK